MNLEQCVSDLRDQYKQHLFKAELYQAQGNTQKGHINLQVQHLERRANLKKMMSLFRTNRRVKRQNSVENYLKVQAAGIADAYAQVTQDILPNAQNMVRDGVLGYYGDMMQWFGSLPSR